MRTVPLGKSGLTVSRLAFGTLTIAPMQRNFPAEKGAELILYAYEKGINFFDTAELYETYAPLRLALKKAPGMQISTKTYAYSRELAQKAFDDARLQLDRDVIDLFMLHEQESRETLRGHREAFDFFLEMKAKGKLRAVGVSTHRVAVAEYAPRYPGLDVLHPLINVTGVGIQDGTRQQMEEALSACHQAGIGIFAMKPLGGGHLLKDPKQAFDYLRGLPFIDCVACGMQSPQEIDVNCAYFEDVPPDPKALAETSRAPRELIVQDWCQGCGACERRCGQDAIHVIDGRAVPDPAKCVRCGYCAGVCPEFCIKVI